MEKENTWVDQIKDVFLYKIGLNLHKSKNKNLGIALKKLSRESGIPYAVLGTWYQEFKYGEDAALFCKKCGNFPVRIHFKTGKPLGPKSQYFGLCSNCIVDFRCFETPKGGSGNVKKR